MAKVGDELEGINYGKKTLILKDYELKFIDKLKNIIELFNINNINVDFNSDEYFNSELIARLLDITNTLGITLTCEVYYLTDLKKFYSFDRIVLQYNHLRSSILKDLRKSDAIKIEYDKVYCFEVSTCTNWEEYSNDLTICIEDM